MRVQRTAAPFELDSELSNSGSRLSTLDSRLFCTAIVLILAAGCGGGPDLETARKFQQAEQEFAEASKPEDFMRVAGLYQEILDRGFLSGGVLYNQGNAFMKAGQKGRGIAAYRQAKRYRPRDPFLEANLRNALSAQSLPEGDKALVDHVLFWQAWISYPEKFFLTTAAIGLTLVLGMLARLLHRRSLFNRLALAAVVLSLVFCFSTAVDWYRFDGTKHGVVVVDRSVARKGNSDTYEPAFTQPLSEGTEFIVVEQRGDWLLVRVGQSAEGWIPESVAVVY